MPPKLRKFVRNHLSDSGFMRNISRFEGWVSKLLSISMVMVIIVIILDLGVYLFTYLGAELVEGRDPDLFFGKTLLNIFGFFLSVLIALEILENITAYLRKHVVQVELVIVTSLTAVARKIIILDLKEITGLTVIGLAIAILALSISYFIVKTVPNK